MVVLLLLVLGLGQPVHAALSKNIWNADENYILLNNNRLDISPSLTSVNPGTDNVIEYLYIDRKNPDKSIAQSKWGESIDDVFQHVFAYGLSNTDEAYAVNNIARQELIVQGEGKSGKKGGSKVVVEDEIDLDGSLLLVKSEDKDQTGLLASFELLATREYERETRNGTKIIKSKVAKGKIELIGTSNGKIKIKTKGSIKKKHIASIENEIEGSKVYRSAKGKIKKRDIKMVQAGGDLFQVNLSDMLLPYKFCCSPKDMNNIKVEMLSHVVTNGKKGGGEVIFMPDDEPVLPYFLENNVIPEPASILFLLSGGMLCRRRKAGCSK
ncbi:MAG: hypothetical protein JW860_06790 [Sedimentisphaerales bacterium]|nr:hypothetical protein [Sedimentisphaerales bacterium]